MELKKYKLGDIADIINGVAFQPSDICNEGVRILRGGNIQSKRIIIKDDDVFLPLCYTNEENQVKIGDTILVASTGSVEVLGKAATCFDEMKNTQIGAFLRIIRPKEERYSMLISIALNSEYFAKYIKAQARGTSINNITIGYLKEFEIYYPKNYLPICDFYQTLEKKIALNRAINDNLEAMAKQLYDYWFVQFDYPNEEGKPYKSSGGKMVWDEKLKREIPEGWEVKTIGTFADVKRGSTITKAQTVEGDIKVVAAATDYSFLHNEANRSAYVITVSASGANAGFINFWREPIYASDCSTIQCEKIEETLYYYYWILHFQELLFTQQIGAAQPHVYPEHINKIPIVVPSPDILAKVKNLLVKSNQKQSEISREIESLTKQRDELLPLLMNGQVSVNYHLSDD